MDIKTRRKRQRRKIRMQSTRYRLSVHRSNKYFYVQLMEPQSGNIIYGVSSKKVTIDKGKDLYEAMGKIVGEQIAKAKVSAIVFDRSGYGYHGKIKRFADAVRKVGIKF